MANALTQEQLSKIEQFSPEQRDLFIKRLEEEGQTQNFIERAQATKQQEQKQTTPEVPKSPATPSPVKEEPQVNETEVRVPEVPKQEETPARTTPTQTTPTQQTPQKATPTIDRNVIRQAFEVGAARGLDVNETIENIKGGLEKRGMDVSTFEQDNEALISTFSQFNNSPDSFFTGLQAGETYGKVVQDSPSYKAGKQLFDKWNAQDKSEEGIYLSLKNETTDPTVLNEMKKDPVLAERINTANKRIVTENALAGDFSNLYSLPVGQQFDALEGIMEKWGLSKNYEDLFSSDNTLSTNSQAYLSSVGELEKLYKERQGIRSSIDVRYPNATEAFKSALYTKEVQAINGEIAELEGQASTYKTTYDFRLGEIKAVADLEEVQNERKYEVFTQLRERNFDLYLEEIQKDRELANKFSFLSPGSGVVASTNSETGEVIFYNSQNVNIDSNTGSVETITTSNGVTIGGQGYDFRNSDYVSQYPRNASFKNNNPAGLTFTATSQKLKNLFDSAGIGYSEGTNRPEEEGGSYISFDNLSDGLSAMKLSFYNTGWTDVKTRLMAWKGAGTEEEKEAYANDILRDAFGSTNNLQFSDMSSLQKEQLLVSHLKREDSALYSVLKDEIGAITQDGTIDYGQLKANGQGKGLNIETSINGTDVVLGNLGVPVEFERTIKSQVPATQLNSDEELAQINNTIKVLYKAGYSVEQASEVYQGFKIRDPQNLDYSTGMLRYYRGILNKPDGGLGIIAANINTGAINQAVGFIETLGEQQIKQTNEKAPTRAETREALGRYSEVLKTLPSEQGVISGTIDAYLGKLSDVERTAFRTNLALLNLEEQTELFGAQITGNEEKAFEDIKLSSNNQMGVLLEKIKALKSDKIRSLNSYRGYTLPQLTEAEIMDDTALSLLYRFDEQNSGEKVLNKDFNEPKKEENVYTGNQQEINPAASKKEVEEKQKEKENKSALTKFNNFVDYVNTPIDLGIEGTLSAVRGAWESAEQVSGGLFQVADKAIFSAGNEIRKAIGKEPLTKEEAINAGLDSAGGLETKLTEDFLDVGGGSLELGLTGLFPASSIVISTANETDTGASVLGAIGTVMQEGGQIINNVPILKQYRDSLPEDRRADFDAYVGQLSTAGLIKAGSKGKQSIINKYKKDTTSAITKVLRPTAKEIEFGIYQGAEEGVKRAMNNWKGKSPESYTDLGHILSKNLSDYEKRLNTSIKNIDSKLGKNVYGKNSPYVEAAINQLKKVYEGLDSPENKKILKEVNDLDVAFKQGNITVENIQALKRVHTNSNNIFNSRGVERGTMDAADLGNVRRGLKELVEENGKRAGEPNIKQLNKEYSEALNANTLIKSRNNQLKSYEGKVADIDTMQEIAGDAFKYIKAPFLELINRKQYMSIKDAELQIRKIGTELKKNGVQQSKIDIILDSIGKTFLLENNLTDNDNLE